MLLLHEVHRVSGPHTEAFEAAFRDRLLPALAATESCRLLWFLRVAHGSAPSLTVVTVTGCRDANAWAELAERVRTGDLSQWASDVDAMRHTCEAKILVPVPWSPLQHIDLATVPTSGVTHPASLFMEDTALPFPGGLRAYVDKAGRVYDDPLRGRRHESARAIELEAAFQPLYGSHHTNEVILWQRVVDHDALLYLLANDRPQAGGGAGESWLDEALAARDRWESRLLRAVEWSPLY